MPYLVLSILLITLAGCYSDDRPTAYVPKRVALTAHQAALAAFQQGDFPTALAEAQLAFEADPGFDDAAWLYASLLGGHGEEERALEILRTLRERSPDLLQAHILEGILWDRRGNREHANLAYDRALLGFEQPSVPAMDRASARLFHAVTVFLRFGKLDGIRAIGAVLEEYPEYRPALYIKQCMQDKDRQFLLRWFGKHAGGQSSVEGLLDDLPDVQNTAQQPSPAGTVAP